MGHTVYKYDMDGSLVEKYYTKADAQRENDITYNTLDFSIRNIKPHDGYVYSLKKPSEFTFNPDDELVKQLKERRKELKKEIDLINSLIRKRL